MGESGIMLLLIGLMIFAFSAVFLIASNIGEKRAREKMIKEIKKEKLENQNMVDEMLDSIERNLLQYNTLSRKTVTETLDKYRETIKNKK